MMRAAAIVIAILVLAFAALVFAPGPTADARDVTADAALVLSGDVDYLRVKHAVALYKDKRVKAILLTGAGVGGDSGTAMRDIALLNRVPAEAIFVETTSTTTRENVMNAAPVVARYGWRRVALVTSVSHMRRALAAAAKAMPGVDFVPAAVPDAGTARRAAKLRVEEALKLIVYKARGWA